MIKYIVKGDLKSRAIETQYFKNDEKPIQAREEALTYFQNLVDILKDSNENFITVGEFTLEDGTIISFKKQLGVELVCLINNDELTIDFFGEWGYDVSDKIAFDLKEEYEFYLSHNLEMKDYSTVIQYCDTDFYEEDGIDNFKILKTSFNFEGKDKPYWWLSVEEKKDLINEMIEDLRIHNSLKNGESNLVEYKPSLVYNFKTKKGAIGVKNIIAKTICAFLNSNGGTLLIGVNDKKEIIGLEPDFSLCDIDDHYDWFRLQFDDLMYQFFDTHVWNYIIADFNKDYEKEFFSIKISPSDLPVFLRNKFNKTKEFYIRNAASTKRLNDVEEIVRYSLSHWK